MGVPALSLRGSEVVIECCTSTGFATAWAIVACCSFLVGFAIGVAWR